MEQERVMEQNLDVVMLSSTVEHAVTKAARVHAPSMEEQDMWDNQALFPDHFDAGIDCTAAAVHERKRLERSPSMLSMLITSCNMPWQAKHIKIAVNLRIAQETKWTTMKVRAVQKKLVAAKHMDDSGPGSKKQRRTRVEEMDGLAQSGMLDSMQEAFKGMQHTLLGSEC